MLWGYLTVHKLFLKSLRPLKCIVGWLFHKWQVKVYIKHQKPEIKENNKDKFRATQNLIECKSKKSKRKQQEQI